MTYDPVGPAGRTLPVITGDWGGNLAGVSLCAALAVEGLIIDNTTNGRYASAVLSTAGLIDYWRLNETSGTIAADSKGSNAGTYVNGATFGTASFAGSNSTGITLDGSSQFINIPHSASLNVGDTFSLELWVKRSTTQGTIQALISKGLGTYSIQLYSDNFIRINNSGYSTITISTVTLTDTASWHHIVYTKSGATSHLYLDNVDVTGTVNTGAQTTMVNNALPLKIGDEDTYNIKYSGSLDEIALYNVALSPVTVAAHWAQR